MPASKNALRLFISASSLFSIIVLCGCGDFFPAPGTPTSGASFSINTRNVVYTQGGIQVSSIPRPNQPLAGGETSVNNSGLTPTGGTTYFGAASATASSFTPLYSSGTGYLGLSGMDLNRTWNLYYNYLPAPQGCSTSLQTSPTLTGGAMRKETQTITTNEAVNIDCDGYIGDTFAQAQPAFSIYGSTGGTFTTVATTPLTTSFGNPILNVFDGNSNVIATAVASSIAADGVTATFPFPTKSGGTPLSAGMYSAAILNVNSGGSTSYAGGGGFFSIGSLASSYSGAFGVAAVNTSTTLTTCEVIVVSGHRSSNCGTGVTQASYPMVTLPSQNEVSLGGTLVQVGANPTSIVAYGSDTYTTHSTTVIGSTDSIMRTYTTTGTGFALVTNTGSGTINILDVLRGTVSATITVGSGPVAAVVTPDSTTAYVVNSTEGTVSKVSLVSFTQTAKQTVGTTPTSIDLDASGNVWVGGAGYITELNPSTLSPLQSGAVSGNITSLAISKSMNRVLTTVVANTSGAPSGTINYGSANASVQSYSATSASAAPTSLATASAQPYSGSLPTSVSSVPAQLATGTLVSANYGNALVVSLTPTGFTVQDISGNRTLMTGVLPGPGRGLAVDPDNGFVYITVPTSNAVITIPLPNEPQS